MTTDHDVLTLAARIAELELRLEDLAALVAHHFAPAHDDRHRGHVTRCAEPACPYLGHWPSGYCPEHRQEGTHP